MAELVGLKRHQIWVKQHKLGHSKTVKENSTDKLVENAGGHANNQMQKKQNNFGVKKGEQTNYNRKVE